MIDIFSREGVCLVSSEREWSFKEIGALIEETPPTSPYIVATPTLSTLVSLFSHLFKRKGFCLLSPKEPRFDLAPRHLESPYLYLATSGTTKRPKWAKLTLENLLASALHPHPDLVLTPQDACFLSLSLHHIGGLMIAIRAILAGARILLPDRDLKEATLLSFVPLQLKRLLEEKKDLPRLRALLLGGETIPHHLCLEAAKRGLPLYPTYGMTEMSSQIATSKFDPNTPIQFSPLPLRELDISEEGELFVKGPMLFCGYDDLPSPFHGEWFPTKDLATYKNASLSILGRKDNMIISGGENIHLEEIEQALMELPYVASCTLKKRKDSEYGERPIALIDLSWPVSKETIRKDLIGKLERFKVPSLDDIQATVVSSL